MREVLTNSQAVAASAVPATSSGDFRHVSLTPNYPWGFYIVWDDGGGYGGYVPYPTYRSDGLLYMGYDLDTPILDEMGGFVDISQVSFFPKGILGENDRDEVAITYGTGFGQREMGWWNKNSARKFYVEVAPGEYQGYIITLGVEVGLTLDTSSLDLPYGKYSYNAIMYQGAEFSGGRRTTDSPEYPSPYIYMSKEDIFGVDIVYPDGYFDLESLLPGDVSTDIDNDWDFVDLYVASNVMDIASTAEPYPDNLDMWVEPLWNKSEVYNYEKLDRKGVNYSKFGIVDHSSRWLSFVFAVMGGVEAYKMDFVDGAFVPVESALFPIIKKYGGLVTKASAEASSYLTGDSSHILGEGMGFRSEGGFSRVEIFGDGLIQDQSENWKLITGGSP